MNQLHQSSRIPGAIRLADYRVPDFLVDTVALYIDIRAGITRITADLAMRRNPASGDHQTSLRLDGEGIALREILLDGIALNPDEYELHEKYLQIERVPESFRLRTIGEINPALNTALEGLYVSHGMYCTQCEAEGFRRITWYPDRPDVMARFRTTIEADQASFPLLLSNGNRVSHEVLPAGRHRVTWDDPFAKPCYLFALVAGDLACREDRFVTCSGRKVTLQIFVEPHDLDKTDHAMASLKRAMRWDEEVYGREYDLDIYMIVAVSHFNMGAMENKGLNIFNTSCVLASQRTQTDQAFQRVEAVIAHEYFHNWSGNRVTCRDWFQLSLKEGFTVFRDAEFSKDMHSRAVKRIEEVVFLRTVQFAEDSGPLAHPVRPEEYVEINNFYTVTIYEKGAEVVRMLHVLLGAEGFRRGCDMYFERHDGQAVTCDDFVRALEDANTTDLTQFRRWYSQAGTPAVEVEDQFDAQRGEYRLRFRQSTPPTPGQAIKQPLLIPFVFGLLDAATGAPVALVCDDPRVQMRNGSALFSFDASEAELVCTGVLRPVLPSLLRDFSAPVRLQYNYTDAQLAFLARHDSDAFNRWDAGQTLMLRVLLAAVAAVQQGLPVLLPALLTQWLGDVVARADQDPALAAATIALPSESWIADQMAVADPGAVHVARQALRKALAGQLRAPLLAAVSEQFMLARSMLFAGAATVGAPDKSMAPSHTGPWSAAPAQMARRALHNALLDLLTALSDDGDEDVAVMIQRQFDTADNMTDQFAALRAAVHGGCHGALCSADELLARFYAQWCDEALVIDQWFSLQVTSPVIDALARAQALLTHPDFELTNPNRVRALVGAFAGGNPAQFHRVDGAGYRFLAEQIIALDRVNPQIAARMANYFSRWRRVDAARQTHAAAALDHILAQPVLSPNLHEVVAKTRHDGAA